ncbi:hypothetical protein BMF94_2791 [Rhodotorula taiwanensis]|uniref:Arrestin-like N-terminal domain-containing protein n=1 Tax=Rhodotorula taiwanensis TaxID=741276 RepID=A0A2S5BB29_9BASI|nr:hypothetical protein BMF94_2791 [Rhodotorula taiwanensis]
MVAFFKRTKDEIHVSFLEDILYLHPPSLADEPSHDPILRGQVTLILATPRKAKKIRVELVGRATRHAGDGGYAYESSPCLEKHLEIDLLGEVLGKGTHTWNFSFILPSSTAVTERSDFGTIRHSVRAVLHGSGAFRDLTSTPKPVFLIANPAAPGDLPSGLEIDVRQDLRDLGPIALHISSPHLTVASLLFLGITLEKPPEGLKIMSVQAFVRQQFEVHYSNPDLPTSHPPEQRKLLFYADSSTPVANSTDDLLERDHLSRGAPPPLAYEPRALLPQPLARLEGGKEWMYARVTRIPDDDSVRPTTLQGTDTPIRVKHALVAQVKFRFKGSKKDHVLEMESKVDIASCCCLTSSLLLPTYRSLRTGITSSAPSTAPSSGTATPTRQSRSASPGPSTALSTLSAGQPIGVDTPSGFVTPAHRRCLCNIPLQKLVDEEGERLCGAAESRSRSRHPRPRTQRSRSNTRQLAGTSSTDQAANGGDVEMHDDGEVVDEDEDGDGNIDEPDRGRPARRKVGETYAVPVDPTGASYDLADSSSARAPALRIPGTTLNLAPTPSAIRRGHAIVASRA